MTEKTPKVDTAPAYTGEATRAITSGPGPMATPRLGIWELAWPAILNNLFHSLVGLVGNQDGRFPRGGSGRGGDHRKSGLLHPPGAADGRHGGHHGPGGPGVGSGRSRRGGTGQPRVAVGLPQHLSADHPSRGAVCRSAGSFLPPGRGNAAARRDLHSLDQPVQRGVRSPVRAQRIAARCGRCAYSALDRRPHQPRQHHPALRAGLRPTGIPGPRGGGRCHRRRRRLRDRLGRHHLPLAPGLSDPGNRPAPLSGARARASAGEHRLPGGSRAGGVAGWVRPLSLDRLPLRHRPLRGLRDRRQHPLLLVPDRMGILDRGLDSGGAAPRRGGSGRRDRRPAGAPRGSPSSRWWCSASRSSPAPGRSLAG